MKLYTTGGYSPRLDFFVLCASQAGERTNTHFGGACHQIQFKGTVQDDLKHDGVLEHDEKRDTDSRDLIMYIYYTYMYTIPYCYLI